YAAQVGLIDVKEGLDPFDEKRIRIARKVIKVEVAPPAQELPSLATTEGGGLQPGYRPAHSVSAGVLGVAKARRGGRDDSVGIVANHQAQASAAQAGVAPVPGSQDHPLVMGLPAELAPPAAPQQPSQPVVQQPSEPVVQQPSQPVVRQPSQPVVRQPSQPLVRQPSQPVVRQPSQAPVQHPSAAPVARPPQTAVRLTLDSGDEYVLSAATIFGRNPDGHESYGPAQCEPVPDHT